MPRPPHAPAPALARPVCAFSRSFCVPSPARSRAVMYRPLSPIVCFQMREREGEEGG